MGLFRKDLETLIERLRGEDSPIVQERMSRLVNRLVELRDRNMLKINHSVLEMIVARHLIEEGYEVDLEFQVDGDLTCDVYARKGMGEMIVEVETGYVPPSHALDPVNYIRARIASKIARYSNYCHRFVVGAPPHYIMPIPEVLTQPPRMRDPEELGRIKEYCDMYYTSPPVTDEEILHSRIHHVFIIDVENISIREEDPVTYFTKAREWYGSTDK